MEDVRESEQGMYGYVGCQEEDEGCRRESEKIRGRERKE
jgi:hypothetical protein